MTQRTLGCCGDSGAFGGGGAGDSEAWGGETSKRHRMRVLCVFCLNGFWSWFMMFSDSFPIFLELVRLSLPHGLTAMAFSVAPALPLPHRCLAKRSCYIDVC